MLGVAATIRTSAGPRRLPSPPQPTVRVLLAAHELDLIVRHYEAAAAQAAEAGMHRTAEAAAWRAACLRRPEVVR